MLRAKAACAAKAEAAPDEPRRTALRLHRIKMEGEYTDPISFLQKSCAFRTLLRSLLKGPFDSASNKKRLDYLI
jgi:hypothetical protein